MDNTNGNGILGEDFIKVFVLQIVQCQNCNKGITADKPVFALDQKSLEAIAIGLHLNYVRANAVLCGDPNLMIFFGEMLMDKRLANTEQKEIIH